MTTINELPRFPIRGRVSLQTKHPVGAPGLLRTKMLRLGQIWYQGGERQAFVVSVLRPFAQELAGHVFEASR